MTVAPNLVLPERWTHAYVERRLLSGEIAGRWEIIDLEENNHRYPSEGYSSIRCTCLSAATVLPIYGTAYLVWHAVRAPLGAISTFFHTVEELMTRPSISLVGRLICLPVCHFAQGVWMAIRTPLFMIALESAALYGLVRPLEGRRCFASIERVWRGEPPFTLDFHQNYLVRAFQPYGALNDPSVVSFQFSDS